MGIVDFFFGKKITAAVSAGVESQIKAHNAKINYGQKKSSYSNNGYGYHDTMSKWPGGLSSPSPRTEINHKQSRQLARNLMQDVPQARALVTRLADSVVDTGLVLQSIPKADILGISAEQAEAWGRDVSERFHLWAMSKGSHRARNMNFYQAQGLYGLWQQRDNDMFTRLYYSSRRDLLSPLQYEFIDPNQINGHGYTFGEYQYKTVDGIEKNADGSERSYNVWIQKNDYSLEEKTIPRVGPKSGRVFMIHGFKQEYAGQTRGFSPLSHAIQDLENITDFSSAHIKKAINNSNILATVENQQQDAGDPFEGMKTDRSVFDQESIITETVIDNGERFCLTPKQEAALDTPGSLVITDMAKGDHLNIVDNKTPSEGFDAFITPFFANISASLSTPIEVVLMKFNQNYSASRATLLLFWRILQIHRNEMIADFNNPIYEMFLSEEIAAGRIIAVGWQDARLKAAWLNAVWIGAPLPAIDPNSEAKANMLNLQMAATNQEKISQELNGSSAKDNIAINSRLFEETPLPPWLTMEVPESEDEEKKEEDQENG